MSSLYGGPRESQHSEAAATMLDKADIHAILLEYMP